MNAKRAKTLAMRQRYLRALRGQRSGVSPVVATLILILIAVAAAAVLYLWLVAWQGNITGGIGQPSAQTTLSIGGSTSVYPFANLGSQWFSQNQSDVKFQVSQGGTGAGMLAACEGHVDIGMASSPQTVVGLQANDNCPTSGQVTITTVAYDAVDVVLPKANAMGIQSMNATILAAIYIDLSTTTPSVTFAPGLQTWLGTLYTPGAGVHWNQIPTTANCAQATDATLQAAITAAHCTASTDVNAIHGYERSDTSGTEQTFTARLLGATSASALATSPSGLGYGGCGSDGQLASCGIAVTGENGNPAVISAVAADANGIGFASDGLARATSSGVAILPFDAVGQTCVSGTGCQSGGVLPTTGSSGTISAGIKASTTTPNYYGWRPFEFVTLQPPTGEAQRFIQFLTDPQNNINIATSTAEVSIYSV